MARLNAGGIDALYVFVERRRDGSSALVRSAGPLNAAATTANSSLSRSATRGRG